VGDLAAYESNGVAGLANTIQWLIPGADNDFRFQDIANGTSGTPCFVGATVCVSFIPVCTPAIASPSLTMTYTPDDGSAPATFTGAVTSNCIPQSKIPGTLSWSFSSGNYLGSSGTQHITTCGPDPIVVNVYPNTYTLKATGCHLGSDGTEVTLTASGGISGTCTATGSGGVVSCTIPATAPVTTPVTLTITAARHAAVGGTTWNACQASIGVDAAAGYTCCSSLPNCVPLKDSRVLHTPLGDFAYSQFAGGSASTFTAVVDVTGAPGTAGLQDCNHPATVPVLFRFDIPCSAANVTITYSGCFGTTTNCDGDLLAQQYDSNGSYAAGETTGIACFTLTPACPPATIGSSAGPIHPNRYWNGAISIDEA
jgi:hypothetical protein